MIRPEIRILRDENDHPLLEFDGIPIDVWELRKRLSEHQERRVITQGEWEHILWCLRFVSWCKRDMMMSILDDDTFEEFDVKLTQGTIESMPASNPLLMGKVKGFDMRSERSQVRLWGQDPREYMHDRCCNRNVSPKWSGAQFQFPGTDSWDRFMNFEPGYNCKQDRGEGSYHGRHGIEQIYYTRHKPTGDVVQLMIMALNWPTWDIGDQGDLLREGVMTSVDLHSTVSGYESHWSTPECQMMSTGETCYVDGPTTFSAPFENLVSEGAESMYQCLESWWESANHHQEE